MAFSHTNSKGQVYYLHSSKVTLKGGYQRDIYYFSKEVKEGKSLDAVPAGYEVSENSRTGLPLLKKAGGEAAKKEAEASAHAKPAK